MFQDDFDPRTYVPNQKGPYHATSLRPHAIPSHQEIFYKVVDNNIAAKHLQNILTIDWFNKLLHYADLFTYVGVNGKKEYHAGTMLFLIQNKTNPTSETSMDLLLKKL